jgi:catechol 2,3-dioxygenase-like lactoylglutathione lyase family enzyme
MHPEAIRELFDERGLLRRGALEPPPREAAFTVFAQREHASFEAAAWARQAEHFFGATLGLTADKRYDGAPPDEDAAAVVVHRRDGAGTPICLGRASPPSAEVRLVFARPAQPADHDAADRADAARGPSGMADLARRCRYVYLVCCEPNEGAPPSSDGAALHLAAILASVLLGPILDPSGDAIFGVKTARELFARRAAEATRAR